MTKFEALKSLCERLETLRASFLRSETSIRDAQDVLLQRVFDEFDVAPSPVITCVDVDADDVVVSYEYYAWGHNYASQCSLRFPGSLLEAEDIPKAVKEYQKKKSEEAEKQLRQKALEDKRHRLTMLQEELKLLEAKIAEGN